MPKIYLKMNKCVAFALIALSVGVTQASEDEISVDSTLSNKISQLRKSIIAQDYPAVDRILSQCGKGFTSNYQQEQKCLSIYKDTPNLREEFVDALNQWYRTEADNFHANMLMGSLSSLDGWVERTHFGRKGVSINQMSYFRKAQLTAVEYFRQAIVIQPDLPFGYLMGVESLGKLSKEYDEYRTFWVNATNEKFPNNISLAKLNIYDNQVRWGGSYEAMEAIKDQYWNRSQNQLGRAILENQIELIKSRDLYGDVGIGEDNPDYKLAQSILYMLLDRGFSIAETHMQLSEALSRDNSHLEAEEHLAMSLKHNPFNEFSLWVAATCEDCDDFQKRVQYLEQYLYDYPSSYGGWMQLGRHQFDEGNYLKAIEAYTKSIELKPYEPAPWQMINFSNRKLGRETAHFESEQWFKNTLAYVYPSQEVLTFLMAKLNEVFEKVEPNKRQELVLAIDRHFTLERYTQKLRYNLDVLELTSQEWNDVITYFAHTSNITTQTTKSYREKVVERFQGKDPALPSSKVNLIAQQTLNELHNEFIIANESIIKQL
ncbi:tetratricopeptide repeat protein [Vibrio hangzhouensis]|uniref:tetratricopeptide repeat protein n=1 Tax=Vibrio hangzhouensis TaxID=462991 RepID=UPI001C963B98|nr:tetratricopeptide repeat protein [Vibrio hangzhouensis]MBY6197251.1 tetratricopeptide repeat protein [Vibrio hangzhouensis]